MKKSIVISAIISLVITGIGCLTNYLYAINKDTLLIKRTSFGGEYTGEFGFGISLEKIYPLTDDPNAKVITHLSFDIINFLLYLILIFIIVFIIIKVIKKIKGKKNNNEKEK